MSKILFVENRFRTAVWKLLAEALLREGHQIFWLVENHHFAPSAKYGKAFVVPYPTEKDLKAAQPYCSQYLPSSDRAVNYFGYKDTRHYGYYYRQIYDVLAQVSPDLVIGESTAFYELLIIDACQRMGIRYLHPCTCRYPVGRFSFYLYNTLEPFRGSAEELSDDAADAIIASIAQRAIIPDYMKKRKISIQSLAQRVSDLYFLSVSYYCGEHFHTPSLLRKLKISRALKQYVKRWNVAAEQKYARINGGEFKVLYPVQMQPEANLDIWGNPYRDQAKTVQMILNQLPENALLVVKPNPKAKYEMTEELLAIIENDPRVIPVPLPVPMDTVLPHIGLVVTVTGTIAIECILSGKPVVTLIRTLNNTASGCLYIDDISKLQCCIQQAMSGSFPLSDQQGQRDFIRLLNRTSYAGIPYESGMSNRENLQNVLAAIRGVLQ